MRGEPRERCLCGDPECPRCYPRSRRRQDDDDYGDWLYEQRKQDRLDRQWDDEQRKEKPDGA